LVYLKRLQGSIVSSIWTGFRHIVEYQKILDLYFILFQGLEVETSPKI